LNSRAAVPLQGGQDGDVDVVKRWRTSCDRAAGQITKVPPQLTTPALSVVHPAHPAAAVWGGRIVSDSTLTSRINAARKAVGDSGEDQKLIRTIARKGLRFVGTVRTQPKGDEPAHVTGPPPMKSTCSRARRCRCPTGPPSRCFPSLT
jgi:hypothetical protein